MLSNFIYLVNRLTISEDKIHSSFNGAKLEVMSTHIVQQCVLIPRETTLVEG